MILGMLKGFQGAPSREWVKREEGARNIREEESLGGSIYR